MRDYFQYKEELDDLLAQLRARYMGQDVPLSQLLPTPPDLPPDRVAEQLAYVLTLYLQRTREMKDAEIKNAWRWLRAAIRFLWGCAENDRTTGSILKLAELSETTRRHLDLDIMPPDWAEGFYLQPPSVENLAAAIWMLGAGERMELEELEIHLLHT